MADTRLDASWSWLLKCLIWLLVLCPAWVAARGYYIDSVRGDDHQGGTIDHPWRTLAKLNAHVGKLRPGDTVNLKRGGRWEGQQIVMRDVTGGADKPIVILPYGDPGEARPIIGPFRGSPVVILQTAHLILRDLEITGSGKGPCIKIDNGSGYIAIENSYIHDCQSNGIRITEAVHHTKVDGNIIANIRRNDGVTIHEANWGWRRNRRAYAGSHHVISNNVFRGPFHEDAIDVTSPEVEDVKIIDNKISGAQRAGINIKHTRGVVIEGNSIRNTGILKKAAAIKISSGTRGPILIKNNEFENNHMYVLLVIGSNVEFSDNKVIHGADRPIIRLAPSAEGVTIMGNDFLNMGDKVGVMIEGQDVRGRVRMDGNTYKWGGGGKREACEITIAGERYDLKPLSDEFGFEVESTCVADGDVGSQMEAPGSK